MNTSANKDNTNKETPITSTKETQTHIRAPLLPPPLSPPSPAPASLMRAVLSLGRQGGGSTVTQQLVKNLLLSSERSLTRKLVEMVLALALERKLTKPQLLEAYLNNVYWGHGVYGIASASAAYFGKKPGELELGEAAMLAAMLPAPELLSPLRNRQVALRGRDVVLHRMADAGYIGRDRLDDELAKDLPSSLPCAGDAAATCGAPSGLQQGYQPRLLGVPLPGGAPYRAPFFVSEVLWRLQDLCGPELLRAAGGLHIHTTLDLGLQEQAERLLLEDGLAGGSDAGEAALVAMEPLTGAVRVLVGGRDYSASSYNRAILAKRSPGSAFKPFVYLAALAAGTVSETTELEDEPVIFDTVDQYRPQNFNRKFRGRVSIRQSLVDSLNVPTVKLASMVGIDKVVQMARRLGITSELPTSLSLALGGCEVTPAEMAAAYNTICATGVYAEPHLVTLVRDRKGNTLFRHKPVRKSVVRNDACASLHRMLRAAVVKGTGKAAAAGWHAQSAAGKTGTSDDCRDAWFAGYSPNLTCVVWVGHDNNQPLTGTGATLAAPLWARFMRVAQGISTVGDKKALRKKKRRLGFAKED
eukprot:jgi/Mesvir1/16655/Mv10192-RA.2